MKQIHELIETLDKIEQLLELQGLEALKMDIPEIKKILLSLNKTKSNINIIDIIENTNIMDIIQHL